MDSYRRTLRIGLFVLVSSLQLAHPADAQDAAAAPAAPAFKPEEIEQLIAPIALYPDSLLAQIFMASTYPLEIVEAARWSKANPKVTGKALEDAMQKQSWDASVKSLTAFPQVLTMMNEKLDMTQKLGDAFLAQQSDVMDAVQRLRAKANAEGNLQTTKEQKIIVEQAPPPPANVVVEQAAPPPPTIIKIEPADPQVVYVPTYNPTTVYGGWPYPSYPPYSYYPPGYVAGASLLSFGVGMAAGAALWGNCNWGGYGGHNDVNVNVNNYNNFNKSNINNQNWQHNAEHRKGVGYRDSASQQRYGKGQAQNAKSRDQFRGRAEQGRQDLARGDADKVRDMERGRGDDRGRSDSGRRDSGGQRNDNRGGQGNDNRGGQRNDNRGGQRADNRGGQGAGDRGGQRADNRGGSQRQASQRDAGSQRQASAGNRGSAYSGAGNGRQERQYSDRGQSSRQSASRSGYSGGSRGGGGYSGGGGGRSGGGGGGRGGGGGGGGRGGGGGGRRR